MATANLRIDRQRLLARIEQLGAIGATPEGGVRRLALSDADRVARDQLVDWMRQAGLEVHIDQLGNIFGVRSGDEDLAPVMTGSHIDSVANGGKLDGAYGVLAGLEVIEFLNDGHVSTLRPLVVAAFTNEEGARFQPDMMGSQVVAGGMSLADALATTDDAGVSVATELQRIGYAGDLPCDAWRPHAYVELHIEQGPVLEQDGVCIGAVENLQGISWTEINIRGQANHAGTTPMRLRHDAGYCAAAITTQVRAITKRIGNTQVGTVGKIDLKPDVINVIPGAARLTVDLRSTDETELQAAEALLEEYLTELARSDGVVIDTVRLARFTPVVFAESIAQSIEANAAVLGLSCQRISSGAGHDAQMLAQICPAGMIFVPSVGGVSHNPAEHTEVEDLVAGANVLLLTLLDLANE